jgi:hypothetical protein
LKLNSQYLGRALGLLEDECGIRIGRIPKVAHAGDLWKNLLESNSNHWVTIPRRAALFSVPEGSGQGRIHRAQSSNNNAAIQVVF